MAFCRWRRFFAAHCRMPLLLLESLGSVAALSLPLRTRPHPPCCCRELGASGVRALLAVPISFVSEHIETLEEIDCEYRCGGAARCDAVQQGAMWGVCVCVMLQQCLCMDQHICEPVVCALMRPRGSRPLPASPSHLYRSCASCCPTR